MLIPKARPFLNNSRNISIAFCPSQEIIDKWKGVAARMAQESLFIVGDDDDSSPTDGNTIYNYVPKKEDIVSKSFDSYVFHQ